jgi:hypothetical protein
MPPHFLVFDGNAAWVRSLTDCFAGPHRTVRRFRVHQIVDYVRNIGFRLSDQVRWRPTAPGIEERFLAVPGFTRFPRATGRLLRFHLNRYIARFGRPDAIFYTNPLYAGLLGPRPCIRQAYIAHDVFRFYGWDPVFTETSERAMLQGVDASFVVAQALLEDFRPQTTKPLYYSPMAVRQDHLHVLADAHGLERPAELDGLPRPLVGCTGQINCMYDWKLVGELAEAFPAAGFVFVGPVFAEPPEVSAPMRRVFAMPNVRHVAAQPHGRLPHFWNAFDVCLNPLSVGEHSDRRSPLRLFDYLATDKPILSTAIREAYVHLPHIAIGRTAGECIGHLKAMFAGGYPVDPAGRRAYLARNTWNVRADTMLSQLFDSVLPPDQQTGHHGTCQGDSTEA